MKYLHRSVCIGYWQIQSKFIRANSEISVNTEFFAVKSCREAAVIGLWIARTIYVVEVPRTMVEELAVCNRGSTAI